MKNKAGLVLGILIEHVLALIILFGLFYFHDANELTYFISKISDKLVYLISIMLTTSVGFFWTYFTQSTTEFGKYLHYRKVDNAYIIAFVIIIMTNFILLILSIVVNVFNKNSLLLIVFFYLLIYGLINFVTLISNVSGLIRLRNKFQTEFDKHKDNLK